MSNLKSYFPLLKTREQIQKEIDSKSELRRIFYGWSTARQQEFLDICTGNRGLKILYDAYFKRVFDPENHPEWLMDFLGKLLGKKILSVKTIKSESPLIVDNTSIFFFDVTVILDDGSLVNVEIQKHGVKFPGERAACYSSDLILRQYMRVRKEETINYSDLKPVITIVIMEKSPRAFHDYPEIFMHRSRQVFESGINLRLLQEYLFVPLDIFTEKMHDKSIRDRSHLEAWLTFLTVDDPAEISELLSSFPYFRPIYEQIYRICENVEGAVRMYNEQLAILDKNMFSLMYDETVQERDYYKQESENYKQESKTYKQQSDAYKKELDEYKIQKAQADQTIAELKAKLAEANHQKP